MVNLLSWREIQRKRRLNAFIIWQVNLVFIAAIVIGILYVGIRSCLIKAEMHNKALLLEINKSAHYRQDLTSLCKQQQQVIGFNQTIEKNILKRAKTLSVLQLLLLAIPNSVDLKSIKLSGNTLVLHGSVGNKEIIADLNQAISSLAVLQNNLWEIKDSHRTSAFILSYKMGLGHD